MLRIATIATFLATTALPAAGQSSVSVEPGDQIRVRAAGVRGAWTVLSVTPDTLRLQRDGGEEAVATDRLTGVDVSLGPRSRGAGAARGAGIGGLAGVLTGAALGFADGDDPPGLLAFTAEAKAFFGAVVLGAGGAVTGGIIGALAPGHRWRRFDDASLTVEPAGEGRWALRVTRRM